MQSPRSEYDLHDAEHTTWDIDDKKKFHLKVEKSTCYAMIFDPKDQPPFACGRDFVLIFNKTKATVYDRYQAEIAKETEPGSISTHAWYHTSYKEQLLMRNRSCESLTIGLRVVHRFCETWVDCLANENICLGTSKYYGTRRYQKGNIMEYQRYNLTTPMFAIDNRTPEILDCDDGTVWRRQELIVAWLFDRRWVAPGFIAVFTSSPNVVFIYAVK